MSHCTSGATVRQTNVAVVSLKKNGKKLEIACYKNKVISYRGGQETRLDEVLQIERVFNNVSVGDYASNADIKKCIGVAMDERTAVKYILDHGEIQVAAHEREHELTSMTRDIANIISQKCINKVNMRPFPPAMIEQALKTIGAAVRLNDTAKRQALTFINKLIESEIIPIDRALMKVRVTDVVVGIPQPSPSAGHAKEKEKPTSSEATEKHSSSKKAKKGGRKGKRDDDDDSSDEDESKPAAVKAAAKKSGHKSSSTAKDDENDAHIPARGVAYATNVPALAELLAAHKKNPLSILERAKAFVAIFPKCAVVTADPASSTTTAGAGAGADGASNEAAASPSSVLINIEPHLFRDVEALFASVQIIEHAVMNLSGAFVADSSSAHPGFTAVGIDVGVGVFGHDAPNTSSTAGGSNSQGGAGEAIAPSPSLALKKAAFVPESAKNTAKNGAMSNSSGKHGGVNKRGGKSSACSDDDESSASDDDGRGGRKGKKGRGKAKGASRKRDGDSESESDDDMPSRKGKKGAKAAAAVSGGEKNTKNSGRKGGDTDSSSDEDEPNNSKKKKNSNNNKNNNTESDSSDDDDDETRPKGGKHLSAKERTRLRAQRKAELEAAAAQARAEEEEAEGKVSKKKGLRKNVVSSKQDNGGALGEDGGNNEVGESEKGDSDDEATRRDKKKKEEARRKAEEEERLRREEELEEMRRNGEYFSDEEDAD